MSVTIELYIPDDPYNMCDTNSAIFSHDDLSWAGIDLDLCLELAPRLYSIFVITSVALWQRWDLPISLVWSVNR